MLSLAIKPISNAKTAVDYYFSKDNYYYTGKLSTQWLGVSSAKLNLTGEVQQQALENVLDGLLPNGDIIGLQSKSGEINHRGGYDLTFSAPKSVSYLALVGGHKEFIALHEKAVKTVLGIIEKEGAEARKSGKNGVEFEKTGNLSFATILHDTSREQDPHLHIHALMMNLTERLDGKWRALASDLSKHHGTMEWVMKNQIFLGLVYRSEIALGLKDLGLEIEHTGDPHGLFEIKYFDKDLLNVFSKRRSQIENEVEEMSSSSLKAYDRATQNTRKAKESTDPDSLRARWNAESQALGITPSTYWQDLKQKTHESIKRPAHLGKNREPNTVVLDAIAHLQEKKLAFSYQDIMIASLYFSIGEQNMDGIIHQIDGAMHAKNLIALDVDNKYFTTQTLIDKERELIERLSTCSAQTHTIPRDKSKVWALTDNTSIHDVVMKTMADKTSVIRIQQDSATSRETLGVLMDYVGSSKKIRVLTPSSIHAFDVNQTVRERPQTLWQWVASVGRRDVAETVSGFLHQHQDDHQLPFFKSRKGRELILVDESQRLSPNDLNALLSLSDKRCAKLILLEKPDGLSGFQSDIPSLLDKASVKTHRVHDKATSLASIEFIESREQEARVLKTASAYTSKTRHEQQNTRVLTASKVDALNVNEAIRAQLKEQGVLSMEEKTMMTLTRIPLTSSEKKLAKAYKPDWVLMQVSRVETKKLTVISVDEKTNRLHVRDHSGMKFSVCARGISVASHVYEKTPMTISKGDLLRSTGKLDTYGIKPNAMYEVTELTRLGAKLKQGKKTIHVPLDSETQLPLTHHYASSLHACDFKPVENTIITLPSYALRKNTLALVSESTRNSLTIVTDDVKKAQRYAEKTTTKPSAISLTLDSAITHYGLKSLNEKTTNELLTTLDKALDLLTTDKPIERDCEKALQFAIAHLSEREAVFSSTDLLNVAINRALGEVSVDRLYLMLDELTQNGDLIAADQGRLTTQEALNFETSILNLVKDGLGKVSPFLSPADAAQKLRQANLTPGQKAACELITTTSDQFILIQGFAGTGKTTMTKTAVETLEYAHSMSGGGIDLIAVAPTHQAVKEMKALGIEAQTLKSFLIDQEQHNTLNERSLVLLDESSMVSNRDFEQLVRIVADSGARSAILGDISQHQSIEGGKPSKLIMQDKSARVAWMDDIVRQQVIDYKKAVETLVAGDVTGALSKFEALPLVGIERGDKETLFHDLKRSVVEVGQTTTDSALHQEAFSDLVSNSSPIEMAVHDYLSRTAACRDNTIIIIHENKHREKANRLIRTALMEEGTLGLENKPFSRLVSTDYTTAELYYTQTYQDALQKEGVHYLKKDNQYFQIISVNEKLNIVNLVDEQGKDSVFLPEKSIQDWKIELFKQQDAHLSVGDRLHFKKTDKNKGRFSNERVEVISVSDESFTVKDATNRQHVMLKKDKVDAHWDYNYTATSYSIQGSSASFVIGVADTKNEKTNHFRSFYIMVSRGSLHAMIYTDDYKKLQKQIQHMPDKTSALEALGRIPKNIKTPVKENEQKKEKNVSYIRGEKKNHQPSYGALIKEKSPQYDAKVIVQNLNVKAENVIEALLGKPNSMSSKNEYRYGSKGSLSFCLQGEKRGTWYNFETLEKGNLLHFIQKEMGVDFKTSFQYAADLTGESLSTLSIDVKPKLSHETKEMTDKQSKTKDYALRIARESRPIEGTIASRYLKETRKISDLSSQDIRFHPRVFTSTSEDVKYRPALINIVRDKSLSVVSIEAIYLDEKTNDKAKMSIKPKRSFGSKKGAGVILSQGDGSNAVTYLTEGVETGLSVRDVVKNERVIASMGKNNMNTIDLNMLTKKVVVCLDHDGKSIAQDSAIQLIVDRLNKAGKEVLIAIPPKKGDFNDVKRESGVDGVISALNKAMKFDTSSSDQKDSMSHFQIKSCLEKISNQIQGMADGVRDKSVEKSKSLQKFEMEI